MRKVARNCKPIRARIIPRVPFPESPLAMIVEKGEGEGNP